MIVKLLTEHHVECLSSKEGYRGSSESTLVKCQIVGKLLEISCRLINFRKHGYKMGPVARKPVFGGGGGLGTTQAQTSLRIRAV